MDPPEEPVEPVEPVDAPLVEIDVLVPPVTPEVCVVTLDPDALVTVAVSGPPERTRFPFE